MPFPFSEICLLFNRLEQIERHNPPLLPGPKAATTREIVIGWFKSHHRDISRLDVHARVALLSTLLPRRTPHRVYGIQATSLCRILSRVLRLSSERARSLTAYEKAGHGDLGACLESLLAEGGTKAIPFVTLEDVDNMLQTLATHSRFSGPSIRGLPRSSSEARDTTIGRVLMRCDPTEGKWLVRLILKDLRPLQMDELLVLKGYHFLLPDLLRFQDDFHSAITLLMTDLKEFPEWPDSRSEGLHRKGMAQRLRPLVGTKVNRPPFRKAWGLDHCMKILGTQDWILECKYDGEYCEIHVDLSWSALPAKCIKIFSKSGKDSTLDRKGIQETLVQSLRLGTGDCRIKKRAILIGELVIYSNEEMRIMPFEEIRKHVSRSGTLLGTDQDSQPKAHEHLAIVFFDLLLLDDELVMNRPVEERRTWLRETYRKIRGRALGAEWKQVSFADQAAARMALGQQFAAACARRCEGLVLKPCGLPYFSLEAPHHDYRHSFVKLKKDYAGMGDEHDFAVIGASYNAQQAATASGKAFIKWTTFHLGCLLNKADVQKHAARPLYRHVWAIDQEKCIPKPIFETANILGQLSAHAFTPSQPLRNFDIEQPSTVKMHVVFDNPLVFEVLGSGYEKPSNCNYLMLRHPRVKKLHEDRTWMECVTFQEMQESGRVAREAPIDSESQETRRWLEKLESRCKKKFENERLRSTPSRSTASPRSRRVETTNTSMLCSSPLAVTNGKTGTCGAGIALPLPTPRFKTPGDMAQVSLGSTACKAPGKRQSEHGSDIERQSKRPRVDTSAELERKFVSRPTSSPLGEITNVANATSRPAIPRANRKSSALADFASKLVSLVRPDRRDESQTFEHSQQAREQSRSICERDSSRCLLRCAAVYLAPCVAKTPYITENLLSRHNAVLTGALAHWDRDSHAYEALTEVVSESQAEAGLRKIVLVESKRQRAAVQLILEINALNAGMFRERIEVYDWRVLEECEHHDQGAEKLKKHFVGATLFDDTQKRALFVSERDRVGI